MRSTRLLPVSILFLTAVFVLNVPPLFAQQRSPAVVASQL
ncbi:MAG: hypothetical protein RLZZ436_1244, partial [Planctomycetota bacterium]